MYHVYFKLASKSKFRLGRSFETMEAAMADIPADSTTTFQIRDDNKRKVLFEQPPLRYDGRGVEELGGRNLGIVHLLVDRFHVGTSFFEVARHVANTVKGFRSYPRPLRRGLIKACLDRHDYNRRLYSDVMSGKVGY